jgi:hypothetical protein
VGRGAERAKLAAVLNGGAMPTRDVSWISSISAIDHSGSRPRQQFVSCDLGDKSCQSLTWRTPVRSSRPRTCRRWPTLRVAMSGPCDQPFSAPQRGPEDLRPLVAVSAGEYM